jgi:putative ATPase
MRGSDPDAALYWMAKMIYAGEDPRFVLRRMLIFACEDVGLADPNAVRQAVACMEAFEFVGMPEGRFMLGQLCVYLATAPKSNSGFAFFSALEHVAKERSEDPPNALKDASRDKKGLGHGAGYKYPHAYRDHYVPEQYLPGGMQGTYFYEPSDQGYEARLQARLADLRARDGEESIEKRVRRYAEDADGA